MKRIEKIPSPILNNLKGLANFFSSGNYKMFRSIGKKLENSAIRILKVYTMTNYLDGAQMKIFTILTLLQIVFLIKNLILKQIYYQITDT